MDANFTPEFRFPTFTKLLGPTVHGVVMWITVPLSYLVVVSTFPIWRRRDARLGDDVGWVDLNVVTLISKSVLRPLVI